MAEILKTKPNLEEFGTKIKEAYEEIKANNQHYINLIDVLKNDIKVGKEIDVKLVSNHKEFHKLVMDISMKLHAPIMIIVGKFHNVIDEIAGSIVNEIKD